MIETLFLKIMLHLFLVYQKINATLIDNVKNLDVVMPMSNLIKYSKYYLKKSGDLSNYYKDILTNSITNFQSFKYKTSIAEKRDSNKKRKKLKFMSHGNMLLTFGEY